MPTKIEIPFFGRTRELADLDERCKHPGVTIVAGPPRIGKTRLLKVFYERSREAGRRIGMAQAAEASGDVLLRAIQDAYADWLSGANAREQLARLHGQMRGSYVPRVGRAVGNALKGLADAHPDRAEIRIQLAEGLGAAMHAAAEIGDLVRAAALAERLVPLKDAVVDRTGRLLQRSGSRSSGPPQGTMPRRGGACSRP